VIPTSGYVFNINWLNDDHHKNQQQEIERLEKINQDLAAQLKESETLKKNLGTMYTPDQLQILCNNYFF